MARLAVGNAPGKVPGTRLKGKTPMIIVIILLVAALGILSGWAARQMQADRENTATIEQQRAEIEHLKNVNAAPSENMALENQYLKNENEALRQKVLDHETSLEMVLSELDTSA